MRKPFDGDFPQTQGFDDPCCRDSYAQFGLKGHDGLDFGCPSGTRILAPHDGKIIESTLDPTGYGIYIKIENSVEGSVLAHLREARVGVGDGVKEGDFIAYSDNSGNSTGPHLHWGYYRFPRDRTNGFAGFIDQTQYIGTGSANLDLQKAFDQCRIDRDTHYNDKMALYEELGYTGDFNRTVAVERIRMLLEIEKNVSEKDKEILQLKQDLAEEAKKLGDAQSELDELKKNTQAVTSVTEVVQTNVDQIKDTTQQINDKIDAVVNDKLPQGFWESLWALIKKHIEWR